MTETADRWRSRIAGHGAEDPQQLLANPRNWRIHPRHQQEALQDGLDRIGWVREVIVNRTTGNVVDGHLRVAMAISREEPEVPVLYVDLDDDEEKLVLATFDPIADQAIADESALESLLEGLSGNGNSDGEISRSLEGIHMPQKPTWSPPPDFGVGDPEPEPERELPVTCPHCGHVFNLDLRLLRAEATAAIVVMTRPEREESAQKIADAVGGEIVFDPEPDLPPSAEGHWRAYRHCFLEGAKRNETHVLVLEDDVIPCRHFVLTVEAALAVRPDTVVTFFTRDQKVLKAAERGESWARLTPGSFRYTQAVAIPTKLIDDFVTWSDANPPESPDGDVRLAEWMRHADVRVYATVPSLVEHADMPSTMKTHTMKARTARIFIGTNNDDAKKIDWVRGL